MNNKIDFLYKAISDAQELIKFVHSKTAFAITLIATFIVLFFSNIGQIIEYKELFNTIFWIILLLFLLNIAICIILIVQITYPLVNFENILNLDKKDIPKLKFYLSQNKFLGLKNAIKNKNSFNDYLTILHQTDDNEIIKSLSFELFKISYIRDYKNKKIKKLIFFLVSLMLFYIAYIYIYNIEINNIILFLKENK